MVSALLMFATYEMDFFKYRRDIQFEIHVDPREPSLRATGKEDRDVTCGISVVDRIRVTVCI